MAQRIFIFDSDEKIRTRVTERLTQAGFDILSDEDGKRAFNAITINSVPELIILDSALPEKSTLSICQELRREIRTKNVGVLVMKTGAFDEGPFRECGIKEFIAKPFSLKDLEEQAVRIMKFGTSAPIVTPPKKIDWEKVLTIFGILLFILFALAAFLGPLIFKSEKSSKSAPVQQK